MNASKKIGRLTLLKHCLIFVGILLSIPVIIELIIRESTDIIKVTTDAFKIGSMESVDVLLLLIHLIVISIGIWFFGGKIGGKIIDKEQSNFSIGFMAILKLWVLHFFSATILQAFESGLPIMGWLVTGLILTLLIGVVHGLIGSYFLTNEIKRKGLAIKRKHP